MQMVSKRKYVMMDNFKLYGSIIERVESYPYLGLLLNQNGKFVITKKKLAEQGQKALYALYRKIM